ncbi:8602_t:CDS:2 [Rhizophagus irregularis]|nr:8602_t:CDS:2 [Rhizophagus irregularis]
MLSEEVLHKVQHANYWKRSYIQWGIESWDQFYFKEFPNSTKQISHTMLGTELEILIRNLEPKSRKIRRLLDLKCQLKKFGKENGEEKENQLNSYSIKKKIIGKNKSKIKSKKIINKSEKERMNEKEKEGSIISDHTGSISAEAFKDSIKISLPEIVLNTVPNLVYLDSYNKSNSTTISIEQRFPDEIINWMDFKQKVQIWQPESDKKYQNPIFRSRNITCEKDIWSATDANIFDILTPLEQHIYFLDGRAIKNIVGEPDFVIVDNNKKLLIPWESKTKWVLNVLSDQNIVTLYNEEKKIREGPYAYSSNVSVYHPINQIYGYMCANKLRYGILSTYDQTWFFERGVVGEDHGWLHVSDAITNLSTDPTLLKSVAYVIDLASKSRYTPFLERPIMVSDNVDEEPDSPDREQKDDSEFKYKGNLLPKSLNVATRSQDH